MKKIDFLNEACKTTSISLQLFTTNLTLLQNACHEAAAWRNEHKLPHVEKYEKMEEHLRELGAKLDMMIENRCEYLLNCAKKSKKHMQ